MAESERFLSFDDEDLEVLLDNKDSKNTKTCNGNVVNFNRGFVDNGPLPFLFKLH
jgi:hypothetical protein